MTFLVDNGVVNVSDNGRVSAFSTEEWSTLTTWDSWTSWIRNPITVLRVNLPLIDLGSEQTVNLLTNVRARGDIHYVIHYGNDRNIVHSPANYTTLEISPGDTEIPSITGRYIWARIDIHKNDNSPFPYFDGAEFDTSSEFSSKTYSNIDSSTLPGTVSNRVFSLPGIGGIKSAQVTSQGGDSYNVDMYVYHDTTSTEAFPKVISKGANQINLCFIGVDGRPRDAVFDIDLQTLPEWYIDSVGNLVER